MSAKLEATLKGVNDLKGEISAWEMRLESIKSEINNLKSQKEAFQKEIESKKSVHNEEMDKNRLALRAEALKLSEQKAALDIQRQEFKQILSDFQKEKNSFEREKTDALDMKANYTKMNEKVGQFVMLVKRAAEQL